MTLKISYFMTDRGGYGSYKQGWLRNTADNSIFLRSDEPSDRFGANDTAWSYAGA